MIQTRQIASVLSLKPGFRKQENCTTPALLFISDGPAPSKVGSTCEDLKILSVCVSHSQCWESRSQIFAPFTQVRKNFYSSAFQPNCTTVGLIKSVSMVSKFLSEAVNMKHSFLRYQMKKISLIPPKKETIFMYP